MFYCFCLAFLLHWSYFAGSSMSNLSNNKRNKSLQKLNGSYQVLMEVNLVRYFHTAQLANATTFLRCPGIKAFSSLYDTVQHNGARSQTKAH